MNPEKVWFSTIQYRPDPTDPDVSIPLGVLLEFTTSDQWVIGMVMRAAVDNSQLGAADELTRQILENRSEVLSNEVRRILSRVDTPGQALALLASSNPWSINIAAPRELQVSGVASAAASVEQRVEEFVVLLHSKRMWPRVPEARRPREAIVEVVPSALHAPVLDIPPPWMLPAKAIWKPWNVR